VRTYHLCSVPQLVGSGNALYRLMRSPTAIFCFTIAIISHCIGKIDLVNFSKQKGILLSQNTRSLSHFSRSRKQKGILLSQNARSLSHFSRSRKQKGILSSQNARSLSHFSRSRKQKGILSSQNARSLSHFSRSRTHFGIFRKQTGILFSNLPVC
jgi:hypothetical protein